MSDSDAGTGLGVKRAWVVSVLKVPGAAKGGPVIGANRGAPPPRTGPVIGANRTPQAPQQPAVDPAEQAFDAKLATTSRAIEIARDLAPVNDKATAAHQTMEDSLADAITKSKAGDFAKATTALDAAEAAAMVISDERVAMKKACETRWDTLDKRFDTAKAAVDGLRPAITAATSALSTASGVRDKAKTAVEKEPEDWPAAKLALDALEAALTTQDQAFVTEAQRLLTGMKTRLATAARGAPTGGNQMKLRGACGAAQKKLAGLIGSRDGLGALKLCAAAETATADLEGAAAPDPTAKTKMVTDAVSSLTALSDDQLARKPMAEKAALAFDLCANDEPSGDALTQLNRLYRKSPPAAAFLQKRDEERAEISEKVAALPGVGKLFNADGRVNDAEWRKIVTDPVKAKELLQAVSNEQLDVLGLPHVDVSTFSEAKQPNGRGGFTTSFGAYDPDTGKISLNSHVDALKNPQEALTSILHETYHAQQHALVKKLFAGEIGPDDPNYAQVMMFAANFPPGYLPPSVTHADYLAQPIEIDAENEGTKSAVATLVAAKRNKAATA